MKQRSHYFWITSGITLFCLATAKPTAAQNIPVPDATLPVNSVVNSENNTVTVTGGTRVGGNLFHSFEQFSVLNGSVVDFKNAIDIQNIISRVTGASISNIDGLIVTNGTANFFLINPNGIIFGPNARLQVGGSFVTTTANAIQFENQGFFSASAPNNAELLTVNPSAFLFNQIAAKEIANQSSRGLQVPASQSLLLVGGNVNLNGGILRAPGGRVELGGIAGAGTVGLNVEGNNLRLSFPKDVARANVSLTNGFIDVVGNGGNIVINAQNLDISDTSQLSAGLGRNLGSVGSKAGDITLDVTGAIKIANSGITNELKPRAVGDAGNILIQAQSLSLTDGAKVTATTFGQGNAGRIFVQSNNVSIADSQLITSVAEIGAGNGGDINIQAGNLFLSANSLLQTSTAGKGRAGNVKIDTQNTISIENSLITSDTFGLQDAGNIDVRARAISITEGAELLSRTSGQGNAGNIEITASDSVNISGVNSQGGFSSGLITETAQEDSGRGGNISVTTGTLSLSNGAVLSARSLSSSPGGNITVNVNTLELANGGQLLTSASKSGPAGSITVNATDSLSLSGSDPTFYDRFTKFGPKIVDNDTPDSGLYARVRGNEAANAGNIQVTTRSLQLDNKGTISAATTLGEGGIITLNAKDILLRRNSSITTTAGTASAGGNGGNINIDTDLLVSLENSDITANAFTGKGGNIQIDTEGIFRSLDSDIIASSQFGINGNVEINNPDIEPSRGLVSLPVVPVETEVAQACQPGGSQTTSEFVVTGRGGLPSNPTEALSTDAVQVDWLVLPQEQRSASLGGEVRRWEKEIEEASGSTFSSSPIVEAQGWVIANGEVILTASAPIVTPGSTRQNLVQCHHNSS